MPEPGVADKVEREYRFGIGVFAGHYRVRFSVFLAAIIWHRGRPAADILDPVL